MPEHAVRKTVDNAIRESTDYERPVEMAESIGHLLLDPQAVASGIVPREHRRGFFECHKVKVDRTRHKLACHGGGPPPHERHDIPGLIKPLV
jgi:hypothetical protein